MRDQIELSYASLRQLAAHLLEAIENGDRLENVLMLATFNSHLLAALIVNSTKNKEDADGALDAFIADVRLLIADNFDATQSRRNKDARPQ